MPLTYSTYVSSLFNLSAIPAGDTGLTADLPNIIDYAELRLYRDLDLQDTSVRDSSAALTAGARSFTLPSSIGTFIVTDEINVITPVGVTDPELGTLNSLVPASEEMLNNMWPSVAGSTVPVYFAMVNDGLAIVGPWPDAAYQVQVVGTQRPVPLSSTNTTTILSVSFPDLLLAASMVRLAGFMKNYGMGVDDPKMAMSWEQVYKSVFDGASLEEARKKFTSQGWSSKEPAPAATPPRT